LRAAAPGAQALTCPAERERLACHLGEVQWLWDTVLRERVPGAEEPKPADRSGLWRFFDTSTRAPYDALVTASPDTRVWTWAAEPTVGWVRRRQAHEALIHRVDAQLTAGNRTLIGPRLYVNGFDEALRVMYGGVPD
jgi:hypothetical protein